MHEIPAGNYEIVVDGTVRGTITLAGEGNEAEGEIEFVTALIDGDDVLLDFDVIGLPRSVRQQGADYFTGTVPTPPAP